MICPKCGGGGKIFCSMCKGTGLYHENDLITEQEYIQTCDTEQLAEFLTKVILDDKRFRMTMVGGVNETKLWLKQPHKEEQL